MTALSRLPDVRFATRPLRESDHAFTYANFLKAYRESDYTAGIPNDVFFSVHKQEWSAVLALFDTLVAHPVGDEDEIAGYICWRDDVVGWVYTKKTPWRSMGVGNLLMAAAGFSKGSHLWAMFGSSWALSRARASGWRVDLVPHVRAVQLLLGASS